VLKGLSYRDRDCLLNFYSSEILARFGYYDIALHHLKKAQDNIVLGYEDEFKPMFAKQQAIFEDQIEVLKVLFSTSLGTFLLHQNQVKIFYFKTPQFWESKQAVIQKYLSLPFEITALPSYLKNREDEFKVLYNRLINLSIDQNMSFAEYIYVSPLVYKNVLNNAIKLPKAFDIYALKDAFKDLPTIICGAGPSLNKNGARLNKLRDRALIFAGGRALSVLNDLGVEPPLNYWNRPL